MGTDLTGGETTALAPVYPVELAGGEEASGLADMLHQFLSQNLAESPIKRRQARRLRGDLLFRAAEDQAVCVRIAFHGERIELADHEGELTGAPSITSDFLSTAHLTTGEEGPFSLVLRRKVKVSFSIGQVLFLLRVLRFMRLPPEIREPAPAWRRWALSLVVAAIITAIVLIFAIR